MASFRLVPIRRHRLLTLHYRERCCCGLRVRVGIEKAARATAPCGAGVTKSFFGPKYTLGAAGFAMYYIVPRGRRQRDSAGPPTRCTPDYSNARFGNFLLSILQIRQRRVARQADSEFPAFLRARTLCTRNQRRMAAVVSPEIATDGLCGKHYEPSPRPDDAFRRYQFHRDWRRFSAWICRPTSGVGTEAHDALIFLCSPENADGAHSSLSPSRISCWVCARASKIAMLCRSGCIPRWGKRWP